MTKFLTPFLVPVFLGLLHGLTMASQHVYFYGIYQSQLDIGNMFYFLNYLSLEETDWCDFPEFMGFVVKFLMVFCNPFDAFEMYFYPLPTEIVTISRNVEEHVYDALKFMLRKSIETEAAYLVVIVFIILSASHLISGMRNIVRDYIDNNYTYYLGYLSIALCLRLAAISLCAWVSPYTFLPVYEILEYGILDYLLDDEFMELSVLIFLADGRVIVDASVVK
jgi:succinate dehydrogenase hydrophobic anchor subunit|uniref:hypothetical protein n=1 Tax=Ancyromonas sigmoides TaxID=85707 RepID=UPI0028D5F816|nr:hypothetical protein RU994_mgp41 [Ancyromonas sigmoides]WMQ52535.1 hypothetical protein [Ancyromonas sigmoides]